MHHAIRIALIFSMIILFTSPPSQGEWNTFHGDYARTGFLASPEVQGDIKWVKDLQNGYIDASPIFGDGGIFVISAGKNGNQSAVYRLDKSTGSISWSTTIPGKTYQLSTPAFYEGRLYFGSSSGIFYCLNAENGGIVWQTALDPSPEGLTSSPALNISTNDLYISSGTGILYDLNPENGQIKWQFNTQGRIYFSSPTVSGNTVFIGNDNGNLYAIQDGNELWHYTAEGQIRSSASVSKNHTLYFTCEDGRLYSLDTSGNLNWYYQIGASKSTPAIGDGIVAVGSENGIYLFYENGSLLFHLPTDGPVDSSPAMSKTQLFFTTNSENGELFCSDLKGNIQWSMPLYEHGLSSPALNENGNLAVASDSGKIWSIFTTPPSELILQIDRLAPQREGKIKLTVMGKVLYDTGRPASNAEIVGEIEGNSTRTYASFNGSFALTLNISLNAGNYTLVVRGTAGKLSVEKTMNVSVLPREKLKDEKETVFVPTAAIIVIIVVASQLKKGIGNG